MRPPGPKVSDTSRVSLARVTYRNNGARFAEIDPIIQGLLGRLPKSGDVWPEADRKLWPDLLAGSFKLIYKDKDEATN
jgi:hypothetical protein